MISGGYNATQRENAIKIDIVKLDDRATRTTSNFMEKITDVPGVEMISKGAGIAKPVIRGLSMNNILVMNNGVRIENYQFSENHPLGIDDNNIDQVEVIKGPASLLYGSDAIGGVLNFIKSKPAPIGKITGQYQTQLFSNSLGMSNNFGIKKASRHFFSGLYVGNKTHSDYEQGGGDFVPNSRFNELSVCANTGYTGKAGIFEVNYDYFKQNLGMTVSAVKSLIADRDRTNEIWYQDLKHHLISSQNRLFLGSYKWETNVAYQVAFRKLQTTLDVPVVEMNLNTITYESKLAMHHGDNSEYIVGIQGMTQTNRNQNNRASQFLPDANVNNLGVLSLVQKALSEVIKIQGGLRFDIYKTRTFALGDTSTESYHAPVTGNYSGLNGSVGITCDLSEKFLLRSNFARAFRAPNLSELTSNGLHGTRYEIGNENLESENAYESDVSLQYHVDCLTFDVAGFYNHIDNYIYISPTSDTTSAGVSIYRYKQSDANLRGGEAGVHYHPKNMEWLHLKSTYAVVVGKRENGDFLPFIPADKWRSEVIAEKELSGVIQNIFAKVVATTALDQNHPAPEEEATPGYTLIDLGIGGEIRFARQSLSISISVNNLLDKKYIDHLSTLKEVGYFNPGRNVAFGLNIPFAVK